MEKLTEKQSRVLELLATYESGTNAYIMLQDHKDDLKKIGINTDKINGINATLASLVSKEVATKTKKAYNDKMATYYQVCKKSN